MRKIFSFYLLCLLTVSSWAQENYQKKEFVSSFGDSLSYRLLRPENEQAGSKYPLVLFLHGAGEREVTMKSSLHMVHRCFLIR